MCGFIACFGSPEVVSSNLVAHRGPDQSYFRQAQEFSIEFNRLSVTGGPAGEIPVWSAGGRWEVFLNGEIYNFRDLIRKWGIRHSASDTQVVADGLEKFGIKALRDLRGMFAGIARDSSLGASYVFRDPLGEKPAFWSSFRGGIQVASEATALVALDKGEFALNDEAISDFFRFGYVEEPRTIYSGVQAVGRGAVWRIDLPNRRLIRCEVLQGFSEDEIEASLPELLNTVIREQATIETRSAVALSGGVDSAALTFGLKKNISAGNRLVSISVNLPDLANKSEYRQARKTSTLFGVKNYRVDVSANELKPTLDELGVRSDQPIGDSASVNYLRIFEKVAKLGLKVVYLGHGPDEFFWGYPSIVHQLESSIREEVENKYGNNTYWNLQGPLRSEVQTRTPTVRSLRSFGSADPMLGNRDPFRRVRAFLSHSYLAHNGFAQSDRLAMSFGIEPRTPFGDSRLYGWAQSNQVSNEEPAFDKEQFRKAIPPIVRALSRNRAKRPFFSHLAKSSFTLENPDRAQPLVDFQDLLDLPVTGETLEALSDQSRLQSFAMFSYWLSGRASRGLIWDHSIR